MDKGFLEYVLSFLSDNRRELFLDVVEKRTKHFTIVLEDLYQSHNASAVMRTCDCFGIQDVHIIENRNKWTSSPDVERGSSKWISLHKYNSSENNTANCLRALRNKGYKIVATSPRGTKTPDEIELDKPIAFVFGTEMAGISKEVFDDADEIIRLPMYGFTESFNISVAAAVMLSSLRVRAEKDDLNLSMSEEDKQSVLLDWCEKMLKNFPQYYRAYSEKSQG